MSEGDVRLDFEQKREPSILTGCEVWCHDLNRCLRYLVHVTITKDRNAQLPKLPASDRRWQHRQRHTTTLYPTLNSWDESLPDCDTSIHRLNSGWSDCWLHPCLFEVVDLRRVGMFAARCDARSNVNLFARERVAG
jgi:hypothetical protein